MKLSSTLFFKPCDTIIGTAVVSLIIMLIMEAAYLKYNQLHHKLNLNETRIIWHQESVIMHKAFENMHGIYIMHVSR